MAKKPLHRRMLTSDEVSKWLGMAPRTICLWAEVGELPAIKIGRQWRFYEEDVELWLKRRPLTSDLLHIR